MVTSKAELEIVKQLFSILSDDDKKSFLKSIKSKEKSEQNFTFTKNIKECPHCKSAHFIKMVKMAILKDLFVRIVVKHLQLAITQYYLPLKKI